MPPVWYFAYGSNMDTGTFRGRRQIDFVRALPARVRGWRLALDKPPLVAMGYAVANIVPDAAAEVWGVLYEMAAEDLAHLDLTEGVLVGNYRRIEILVEPAAALETAGMTAFTLVSERRDPLLRPSTRYMGLLIAGAEEHGLPAEYVSSLRAVAADPESELATAWRSTIDAVMRRR